MKVIKGETLVSLFENMGNLDTMVAEMTLRQKIADAVADMGCSVTAGCDGANDEHAMRCPVDIAARIRSGDLG